MKIFKWFFSLALALLLALGITPAGLLHAHAADENDTRYPDSYQSTLTNTTPTFAFVKFNPSKTAAAQLNALKQEIFQALSVGSTLEGVAYNRLKYEYKYWYTYTAYGQQQGETRQSDNYALIGNDPADQYEAAGYTTNHPFGFGGLGTIEHVRLTCTLSDGTQVVIEADVKLVHTNHSYTAVVTAPDCKNGGYTTYACACGYSYVGDQVAALGHTPNTAASCEDDQVCTVCGELLAAAQGHIPAEVVTENVVAPDCDTAGSHEEVVYCTVCGEEIGRDQVVDSPLGHTGGAVVQENEKAGNCSEDGTYEAVIYCAVCEEELSRVSVTVPATGLHTQGAAVKENVVAPDCNTAGSHEEVVYCTVCGEELDRNQVVDGALGHIQGEAVRENEVKASCAAAGSYDLVVCCCVCGEELSREAKSVAKLPHTPAIDLPVAPSCEGTGVSQGSHCSVCKEIIVQQTIIPAKGHSAGGVTVENQVAADCIHNGHYDNVTYCVTCGAETSRETVIVPAEGHADGAVVRENKVTADCTNIGSYDNVAYCIICGTETSRETVIIPPKGHSDGEPIVENQVATGCVKDGSYDNVIYCIVCGAETGRETVVVPAKGHIYGEVIVENQKAADCTNDGSYDNVVYCTECGTETSRETVAVPAKGHTAGEVVVENQKAADCVNDGNYDNVVYCTVCGAETSRETVVIPAKGHAVGKVVVENEVAADCTNDGSYDNVTYCTACDAETSRETVVVLATGHTAGEVIVENEVAADCTNDGSYDNVVYCTVCGIETSRNTVVVPTQGHTVEMLPAVEPDCTNTGLTEGSICTVCGETLVAQEMVAAKGHAGGEVVVENPVATDCTNDGSYDKVTYCTECGIETNRETVVLPARGHTAEMIPAVEPDCTNTGLTEGSICTVCGETLIEQEVIAAKGHIHGEAIAENSVAADCTNAGSYDKVTYCTECDTETKRETIVVPSQGHTNGETVVENEVAADCTNDGSYDNVIYCTVCGIENSRETVAVPAKGHIHSKVIVENEVAADCTNAGSYDNVTYCIECGTEISREAVAVPAKGHTDGEAIVENEVAADCTNDGSYDNVVYCTVCGAETNRETVVVPAKGHAEKIIPSVEPTCTQTGLTEGAICTVCGETLISQEIIAAKGHTDGETVVENEVAADCTHEGRYDNVVYCTVCGAETNRETVVIPATGHTDGETVVENEVAADCTNDGSYDNVTYCTACDAETSRESVVVPAKGHTKKTMPTIEPTCTQTGLTEGLMCAACGETLVAQEVVAAKGHTDGETVVENEVAADCTNNGSYDNVVYCTVCGIETGRETVVVPARGHNKKVIPAVEPDCTNTGLTEGSICTVCGETLVAQEAIAAKGHIHGEAIAENQVAADCTYDGSYDNVIYCIVCGVETSRESVVVPAKGHTKKTIPAIEPTCTQTGLTEGLMCAACGETLVAQEVVAAKGHTAGETVVENPAAADCTNNGSYDNVVYCTVCSTEISRESVAVSAIGHTDGETGVENEVAADCTNDGSYDKVTYCTVCDAETSRETVVVPAKGHTKKTIPAAEPTCTKTGLTEGSICTVCGETLVAQEMVAAKGHTAGEVIVENQKAADCVNDGSYDNVVYCTVCGIEISRETFVVSAQGHTKKVIPAVEPDCTNTGLTEGSICTVCGETLVAQEVIAANGHTDGETVVENQVAAGCVKDGSYDDVIYCAVCDAETSRETVVVPATGHTSGEVIVENEVAADCTNDGSYDNVTYCTVCSTETSRETVAVPAKGHIHGEVVVENPAAADCTNDGNYDNVIYCTVCDAEISRETIIIPAKGHTDGEAIVENEVAADCTNDGSYDNVVCCTVCSTEISREIVVVSAQGHTDGETVVENEVAADCTHDGIYDKVTYCTVCGAETSRETVVVPQKGHTDADDNHKCDVCETKLTDCLDENEDQKCDVCGVKMETAVDCAELDRQLKNAETLVQSEYTAESWSVLEKAWENAKAARARGNQAEVNAAADELKAAIAELERPPEDQETTEPAEGEDEENPVLRFYVFLWRKILWFLLLISTYCALFL